MPMTKDSCILCLNNTEKDSDFIINKNSNKCCKYLHEKCVINTLSKKSKEEVYDILLDKIYIHRCPKCKKILSF